VAKSENRRMEIHGAQPMITYSISPSSIGKILVASSRKGVCMVSMGESAAELERVLHDRFPSESVSKDNAGMEKTVRAIRDMIDGKRAPGSMKFDLQGTDFQKKVWAELLRIPAGKTCSYAEIAERIGHPNAYRAVANACGANPVAIAVPCHRVIASGGKIGGYGGGLARKRKLLTNEGVAVSQS
jgi:AraC family transcriptional regulator, regulatory protein of adaptative response / methylated-DNA-[protein]-cysteine methyltransferase